MTELGNAFIDLTMEDEASTSVNATGHGQASTSHSRSSSDGYVPAVSQPPAESGKKSFSSYEIKSLSASRIAYTRLPDILQLDQKKNVINASQPCIFTGWIQEHEESCAPLTLTNDDDSDPQRVPPADWMYTEGYVLDDSLERPTRRVGSFTIPKGCDCDNELGICDPHKCSCYALHEKLAPNPWVVQDKFEDGIEFSGKSDLGRDFAYKDGRLRPEVANWPGVPIWECNSNCSCSGDCRNRVVQKGRTVAFDLFKSVRGYKGWGIRCRHKIKKGTFITVYAGELLDWAAGEDRNLQYESTDTTYILDIDSHHIKYCRYLEPYQKHLKDNNIPYVEKEVTIEEAEAWALEKWPDNKMTYSVDAGLWGNLSRYFNHSCNPNLEMYPVYTEERDIRRPFLAFFATRDIAEGEELTFAYDKQAAEVLNPVPTNASEPAIDAIRAVAAEQLQSRRLGTEVTVKSSDRKHNLTTMKCGCGADNCRGAVFRRGEN